MTKRKWEAARLLGKGMTNSQVIAETGVPQATFYRWLQDDIFIDAVLQESNKYLMSIVPQVRGVLKNQAFSEEKEDKWLAQNAANSLLRERSTVQGDGKQQIVVAFALDDTDPGMPTVDDVPLDDA